jgi:hypothetical protein
VRLVQPSESCIGKELNAEWKGGGEGKKRTSTELVEARDHDELGSRKRHRNSGLSSIWESSSNTDAITPCAPASQYPWPEGDDFSSEWDVPAYRDFVEKLTARFGERHPETLTARMNLAVLLKRAQLTGEAMKIYKEVIAVRTELFGSSHADTLLVKMNLANLLDCSGDHTQAEELYKECLEGLPEKVGWHHPSSLTAVLNCAQHYIERWGLVNESPSVPLSKPEVSPVSI